MDNYQILKDCRPIVMEMLEKNMEEALLSDSAGQVFSQEARDGNTFLAVSKKADEGKEEKTFRLNSNYRPVDEAVRWAKQYEINDIDAVYFMFGMGNGYFVRELAKKMRKDTLLIVYEPSVRIFKEAMDNSDLSDIIENDRIIIVVRGINDEYLPQAMDRTIFWANMNTLKKCIHPQYDTAFKKEMNDYDKIVWDGYTKARSNVNTAAKFQAVFAPNTLYSMSLMKHNNILMDLYDKLDRDVPVIIASAGPSLEKNIDDLKAAKGRAYILAVDKTIPIFMKHDIMPDFLISIDAKKWPGYLLNPRCSTIPLFCLFEANKVLMARHTGRKIFFDSSEYPKAILMMAGKRTTAFNAGGSVATAAYTVCLALGMKTIFFIGQDLAYLDGKTHAGNISSGEVANGGEENRREVEGIDGNMVTTRADWYRYLDWFNQAIASNPQCHVVDATEGGAKIKGTEILTLKEAVSTYCKKETDCKKMIKDLPPALNERQYLAMVDYVRNSSQELVLIRGKLRRSINDCEKLIGACKSGNINNPKYNKPIKELSRTNQYVEGRPVYRLLDSLVVTDAVAALKDIYVQSDDPDENLKRTFEQSRDFYQALLDAADKLEPILEKTLEDMETDKGECPYEVKNLGVLVILFGLGNGEFLKKILKKCREDTRVIVYEPNHLAYSYGLDYYGLDGILADPRVYIAMDSETLKKFMEIEKRKRNDGKLINKENRPAPILFYDALDREYGSSGEKMIISHPQYEEAFPKKYEAFLDEIEDAKKRQTARINTKNAFGRKIVRNQLTALSLAKQAVLPGSLRDMLSLKKPVVIVSTGPSLMESIDFLREIKDRVYLFAVDSAVNFLLNREIEPDFTITVDPNKWKGHFKREEAKKIPLFCRMDSNLNILKNQTGPLVYFGSTPYGAAVLERFNKTEDWVEDTGGSVSTAALSVCLMLGFERIILVGQDLCYKTDDGKNILATHAHGKISVDEKKQGFDRTYIPGNTEDKVLTRQDWYRYLKWTEQAAAKHPEVLIQNATKGGAKILGIPWISQEELSWELLEKEVMPKESISLDNIEGRLFTSEEYEAYFGYLKQLPAQRKELLGKAEKMEVLGRKLKNAAKNRIIGNSAFKPLMKEVSSLNQWINSQPLYLLADLLVSTEDLEQLYDIKEDEMENLAVTYGQVELMYKKLGKALKDLEPLIDEMQDMLVK